MVATKVDEKIRAKMYALRLTWNDVFAPAKLFALDVKVNRIDPNWPLAKVSTVVNRIDPSWPGAQAKVSSIHVNPIFFQGKVKDKNSSNIRYRIASTKQ